MPISTALKINDGIAATKQLSLAGHSVARLTFVVRENTSGTYTVDVNGLTGAFTVRSPGTIAAVPETPSNPTPLQPPQPTPIPSESGKADGVTWFWIFIAIAAILVVGALIWRLAFYRRQ